MLSLKEVTLVMVETREHELARMAIDDCLRVAEFGRVLIISDRVEPFSSLPRSFDFHQVDDWPTKLGWSQSWWYDVPPLLRTAYSLNIQWDSWISDPRMWSDEFYEYDYIGAPWWYKDGKNVGNGGFSFISTPLKRYLYANRRALPCNTPVDDDLLCRTYRPKLEAVGFRWAPEKVAHDFAFECCRPTKDSCHFGFHAMFNWSEVLSEARFLERMKIASRSKYITNPNGVIWKAFAQKHPELTVQALQNLPPIKDVSHG